jgi:hypothetical protein
VFFMFGVALGAARLARTAEDAATEAAPGSGGPGDGARASAAA